MIRLGIVDFDTSHAVEFTKRLNHVDIAEDQWVEGAKVVAGVPGRSRDRARGDPQEHSRRSRSTGSTILDDPAELFGKVDAVLIESVDGSVHLERAMPFLEKGMPTYVDKPFACSLADAKAMVEAGEREAHPADVELEPAIRPRGRRRAGTAKGPLGAIVGVSTYGPSPTHPRNPGLFHYGIHPVEMLFTLMGPGCKRVTCLSDAGGRGRDRRLVRRPGRLGPRHPRRRAGLRLHRLRREGGRRPKG